MISSNPQQIGLTSLKNQHVANPLDTGRTLNIHETFRRGPGSLLNVLCTFNLRLVLRRNISWNVCKTFRRSPGSLLNVLCTYNLRPMFRRNTWRNVHKTFRRGPGSLLKVLCSLIYVQCSGVIFGEWNLTL